MTAPSMLVWTLHRWPKAQYLAQGLSIPSQAWTIPALFVPVGGPEISAFEAAPRPDLGGLGKGLNALAKLAAAAAHRDAWVKQNLGEGLLAGAFNPGLEMKPLIEMCERDGYRVVHIDDVLSEATDVPMGDDGLHDAFGQLRMKWLNEGVDEETIIARTLALPVWKERHHAAAFFLMSRPDEWPVVAKLAVGAGDLTPVRVLTELVIELAQPPLLKRLRAVASEHEEAFDAAQLARVQRLIPVRR